MQFGRHFILTENYVEKIITQQQFCPADYLWTADSSDRKTTLTTTHTKRTETARCCIPRVNTPFMTWTFDRFRSGNHATNCGQSTWRSHVWWWPTCRWDLGEVFLVAERFFRPGICPGFVCAIPRRISVFDYW